MRNLAHILALWRQKMWKGIVSLIFLVLAIVVSVTLGITSWHISQDVDGWKDRAEVSSEPHDMLLYMSNVKSGMEKWNMTSGNASLFFPTPSTDVGLIYRNVNQYIDQAKVLTTMDNTSSQYQTGLDNLSWAINRLELYSFGYWAMHGGLFFNVSCWLTWILFLVFGIWWGIDPY